MSALDGRIAIVTGAARGIGLETARQLGRAGAQVVLADIQPEGGRTAEEALRGEGLAATYFKLDVSIESDWEAMFQAVGTRLGQPTILVNNAGVFTSSPIEQTSMETVTRLMQINLGGVFLGTKHAIRAMRGTPKAGPSASIINLSSTVGLVGSPFSSIYSMTKGGVRLFTKSTALEVAELGYHIRCNSVHPGVVATDMGDMVAQRVINSGVKPEDVPAILAARHPIGRIAQPAEIAAAIVFLASPASSFMTGSEVVVDGGWTAR
ncbi:SDR family NAD(P)-dependent oxidoreductase [Pseudorhodoferax sp.]|uniref:SDR family NAD(P)-dependent oxidoreductase n=1 Tax=Pseudorhodoferax sp. TaxID=1993553 RepID=UPI0039E65E98